VTTVRLEGRRVGSPELDLWAAAADIRRSRRG